MFQGLIRNGVLKNCNGLAPSSKPRIARPGGSSLTPTLRDPVNCYSVPELPKRSLKPKARSSNRAQSTPDHPECRASYSSGHTLMPARQPAKMAQKESPTCKGLKGSRES